MSADRVPHQTSGAPASDDDQLFEPLQGEGFGVLSAGEPSTGHTHGVSPSDAGHGHPGAVHDDDACAQAVARVHAFLTNQLPASEADLIRAHLDACEKCLDDFDIEATISRLLKKSCGSPCAPDSLRLRVMTLRVEDAGPER